MSEFQDFVQINNQLPYKPIKSIKIINVSLQNNKISIECKCQIQGDLNQVNTIVRTQDDLSWLIQTILNNNKTYLVPKITYQTYLNLIYQKLASGQQSLRNQYEKKMKEKVILRALKLVSTVILNHLKELDQIYLHSIFIFFHKNFGLYKNPIYYKEETTSLGKKMGNFLWQKYAIISGSKNTEWLQIQNKKTLLSNELSKLSQINLKLTQYTNNLIKLQQQFMRQKDIIKGRLNVIEKLLLSYQIQIKYNQIVIQEIQQTLARIEDKSIVQNLMKQYNVFLQGQIQKLIKDNKQLMKYYIKVLCLNEESIKIQAY